MRVEDSKVALYLDELIRWNAHVALVSRRLSREQIERSLVRPILAAVASVGEIQGCLLDVGAGSGMGGILFALGNPGLRVIFIERVRKKGAFIAHACRALGIGARARVVARDHREAGLERGEVDYVYVRAVSGVEAIVEDLRESLAADARVLVIDPAGAACSGSLRVEREERVGAGLVLRMMR